MKIKIFILYKCLSCMEQLRHTVVVERDYDPKVMFENIDQAQQRCKSTMPFGYHMCENGVYSPCIFDRLMAVPADEESKVAQMEEVKLIINSFKNAGYGNVRAFCEAKNAEKALGAEEGEKRLFQEGLRFATNDQPSIKTVSRCV